jgi:hypothetical protein
MAITPTACGIANGRSFPTQVCGHLYRPNEVSDMSKSPNEKTDCTYDSNNGPLGSNASQAACYEEGKSCAQKQIYQKIKVYVQVS